MITRREALRVLGSLSVGSVCTSMARVGVLIRATPLPTEQGESTPTLARGAPMSSERLALIDAFKAKSAGVDKKFELRTHRSDGAMPYRLFRPVASGRLPLGTLEVVLGLAVLFLTTLLEIVVALGRHGFLVVEVKARGGDRGPLKLSA